MKKFLALALAFIMVFALATTAMADDPAIEITINPNVDTSEGTSTGNETYKAYKIFDATFVNDDDFVGKDNTGSVAYTISTSNPFYTKIVESGYFELTASAANSTIFTVTPKANYDENAAKALAATLKGVITDSMEPAATDNLIDGDGKYTLSVNEKGYYMILSSLGSEIIVDTLGDIEVTTKNDYPTLTKKIVDNATDVDSITASYGDLVTFKISVTIPVTAVGEIVVHDTLDNDLVYQSMTEVTGITYADAAEPATNDDAASNYITFTLSDTYVADIVAAAKGENKTAKTVDITYTAKLAVAAETGNDTDTDNYHTNSAYLTYSKFTSVVDTVTVYTWEIPVYKYTLDNPATDTVENDANNKYPLANAKFTLKDSTGAEMKFTKDGTTYKYDSAGTVTEITTDTTGKFIFSGLKDGDYTLTETAAPDGYNILTSAITIKLNSTTSVQTGSIIEERTVTMTQDAEVTNEIGVENNSGTELPSTGGMGTTVFYVIGAVLMMGAVVVLVSRKRMAA